MVGPLLPVFVTCAFLWPVSIIGLCFVFFTEQVVLSPGPGNPSDFGLSDSIALLIRHEIPGFGVCLGLQGMVEHFGGKLGVLSYPMHGKPSTITLTSAGQKEQRYVFNGFYVVHLVGTLIEIGRDYCAMCC
jgi:anthranilate/para-aminobenzoate synthase component II